MTKRAILGPKGFKATSGNHVIHITDLGPDGMHAAWDLKPSDQDKKELDQFVSRRLKGDEIIRHNGGLQGVGRAYEEWKKKVKDNAGIFGEEH